MSDRPGERPAAPSRGAHSFVVILAGGGGTRLWPHSRRDRPKQFLALLPGGETLLGATVRRTAGVVPLERTLVVTTAEQVPEVRRCVPELPTENILIEPLGRNTAPCIGLAATAVLRRDPDGVMAVLPSDHFVADESEFQRVLTAALDVAHQGHVVTLGIRPTHPETGYGYIRVGAPDQDPGAPAAASARPRLGLCFVEKPDRKRAEEYLAAGDYLWNSGTFFFTARRILDEIRRYLPALGEILDDLLAHPERTAARYPEAPAISIDYAVMERLGADQTGEAQAIRVLTGDFGWNDVGSFAALPALHPPDRERGMQNHVVPHSGAAEPVMIRARDNLVWNTGPQLVAALGVEGLVIAVTGDVVLVTTREHAQEVRDIVEHLKRTGQGDRL